MREQKLGRQLDDGRCALEPLTPNIDEAAEQRGK